MTTTEDLLREALRARADRTGFEPTRVEDVAVRARFEQRGQNRGRALVAAAAVAAIALPVGLVLGAGPGSSPEPAGPVEPVTVRIDSLHDLPEGAAPAIDHVDDTTYVFADGQRVDLPVVAGGGVLDAAAYRGGVVFAEPAEPGEASTPNKLTLVDSDGTVRWTRCGSDSLQVSADGRTTSVAWSIDCARRPQPRLEWVPARGDGGPVRSGQLTPGLWVDPVGVTEDLAVVNVVDPVGSERQRVEVLPWRGTPQTVPGLALAAAYDAQDDLVAGCAHDGRCLVVEQGTGSPVLTLDDGELPLAFSPDGRHLATTSGGRDAPPGVLVVRDVATGEVVVRLDGGDAGHLPAGAGLAWEDDEHLLLSRVDRTGEALVRLGLDKSLELATPVREPTLGGYLVPGS